MVWDLENECVFLMELCGVDVERRFLLLCGCRVVNVVLLTNGFGLGCVYEIQAGELCVGDSESAERVALRRPVCAVRWCHLLLHKYKVILPVSFPARVDCSRAEH